MKHSTLILNSVDQFNLHYGETLRRWRANFNAALDSVVRPLGFDDAFIYDEIPKEPAARALVMEHHPRKDATDAFAAWAEKPDKILY